MLTERAMSAVYKWHESRKLPYADGPLVNGRETWRRETFLAWAEANGFAQDADGADLAIRPEAREAFDRLPRERFQRVVVAERSPEAE